MKKIVILSILFCCVKVVGQKTGVNTPNPQATFHVDGAKDNPITGTPSVAQQENDFVVTPTGNVGFGTAQPNAKVEVNSNVSNASGLRLTNLTSSTPVSTGQAIGVDAQGNVVTVPNDMGTTVTTYKKFFAYDENEDSSADDFDVNDLDYTIVSNTSQTVNIPVGGKVVFVNFMLGIDYGDHPQGSGFAYYQARLFIDGQPTNTFLSVQEPGSGGLQSQFVLYAVKALTPGDHVFDIRMKRVFNNGTHSGLSMRCGTISMCFTASYIN